MNVLGKCMMKYWLLAVLALISPTLLAAVAVVEGVQMPAWVEQDGMKTPLTPGCQLHNSDVISTGDGGRAQLKLAEGSTLKLGENAHLTLDNLAPGAEYRIAVAVNQGAFRMTTATVTKKTVIRQKTKKGTKRTTKTTVMESHPRIVNVHLGSLNANSGGGDIWGKASQERDVVAMFKGRVHVSHDDASQVSLTRAGTSVDALDGGTLNAPRAVASSDKSTWLRETELIAGRGVATRKGTWKVSVGTFRQGADAAELMHKVQDEGYAVELAPATVSGRAQTRLQVTHLKTSADARAIAARIRKEFDLNTVTVIH
jgi:hypothetical protein